MTRPRWLILISGILIVVTIVFVLLEIHPPGMSPEVPFLFVIAPLTALIILGVLIEGIALSGHADEK